MTSEASSDSAGIGLLTEAKAGLDFLVRLNWRALPVDVSVTGL